MIGMRRLTSLAIAVATMLCAVPARPATAADVLRVASDVSYAPLEFYKPGTKTVVGFDYDLAAAIAKAMGAKVDFRNHAFASLIPDLRAGKYDVVISSLSDTRERERMVDFIDYFLSGSGILVAADNPAHLWDVASLCGHTVDVEAGTSQESTIRKQQTTCKGLGLGDVTVLSEPSDEQALQHFLTGTSVAHISDYPVVAYVARTTGGGRKYRVIGRQFNIVPFGIAVAKSHPALRDSVRAALLAIVHDGTYDSLLKKWGLEQGALRSAPVNAGTKFRH